MTAAQLTFEFQYELFFQGTPILKRIQNDCHYEFEWPTNVICKKHSGQFREEKCELYNNQTDTAFDLRKLFKDGLIQVCFVSHLKLLIQKLSHSIKSI